MTEKNQHTPGPQGAHGSEDEIQAVIDRILAADDARRASGREATGRGSADSAAADHEGAPDDGTPDRSGALAGRALALDEGEDGHTDADGDQDELAARHSLKRVQGLSTELEDMTEVEYRQLRLERVVLAGVWTEGSAEDAENSLRELAALAETAGSEVLDGVIQRRATPDPATFLGKGKAQELAEIVALSGADTVVVDSELAPSQRRALEDVVRVKVIDRTALILDIFAQHASSREGRAQVELAQLEYLFNRARGWGGNLSRQAGGRAGSNGGVGLRGPGETRIEADRRRLRSEMAKLRHQLRDMTTAREVKRAQRNRSTTPKIAIAGYTNAGKSSLINAMTDAGVLVEDALFATLDPSTRRAQLADGRSVVLTDTVGFVRHLPTQLVEAFKSTLEEVSGADLLLHVVDGSDAFPLKQIEAVNEVLAEITRESGETLPPEIVVVNKIDEADPIVLAELRQAFDHAGRDVVFVSALTGEGIGELEAKIEMFLNTLDEHVTMLVPFTRGDVVSQLHEHGTVRSEEYREEGTLIDVRLPRVIAEQNREFVVS